jgi:hypothetical protein
MISPIETRTKATTTAITVLSSLLNELAARAVETWLIAVEAVEAVERAVEAVERAVETDTFGVEGAETQEFEEDVDIFELK